jgi:hypothetical protein
MACPPPTEPVKVDEVHCPLTNQCRRGVVIKHQVLEHTVRQAGCFKRLGQVLTHLQRLGSVLEDDRVAGHERGRDRVDRRHVRIVPRRDDEAPRHAVCA